MTAETTLSHMDAKALYDRIGRWQDTQRFYEDHATHELIAHAALDHARAVFEFGSGTGRLAERLLRSHLPFSARYRGRDVSSTMVAVARERLAPWEDRAAVDQSDGSPIMPAGDGQFDRFVSTYVLDLLSAADISAVFGEAHRLLADGGLLCLVSATHGQTAVERAIMGAATFVHSMSPKLVGGCRAIDLRSFLPTDRWNVVHRHVTSKWAIPSEVLVATPTRAA